MKTSSGNGQKKFRGRKSKAEKGRKEGRKEEGSITRYVSESPLPTRSRIDIKSGWMLDVGCDVREGGARARRRSSCLQCSRRGMRPRDENELYTRDTE